MAASVGKKVNDREVFTRIAKEIDASAAMAAHLQLLLSPQLESLISYGEALPAQLQEMDHLTQILNAIADYMREVCEQLPGTELDISEALSTVPIRKLAERLAITHAAADQASLSLESMGECDFFD